MDNLELTNQTVLVRVDFNVPLSPKGKILDDYRLKAHLPTIEYLLKKNAKIVLLAHLGRPRGRVVSDLSLNKLVPTLTKLLGRDVTFVPDCIGRMAEQTVLKAPPGSILLMENLRFYKEEVENDKNFIRKLAYLGGAYVNDAFATCHRPHASIIGLPSLLPSAAGLLLTEELTRLDHMLNTPERPLTMIIGGAKLARKMEVLSHAIFKANQVIVGGAVANTLLAAKDVDVGRSLIEPDYIESMRDLLVEAGIVGCRILLPQDAVVAHMLQENLPSITKKINQLEMGDMILDVGPQTLKVWSRVLQKSKSIIWNGPVGAFEISPYDEGTHNLANAIVHSDAKTLAAGRDTLTALRKCKLRHKFDSISTAGAAFLDTLADRELRGVKALKEAQGRRVGDSSSRKPA